MIQFSCIGFYHDLWSILHNTSKAGAKPFNFIGTHSLISPIIMSAQCCFLLCAPTWLLIGGSKASCEHGLAETEIEEQNSNVWFSFLFLFWCREGSNVWFSTAAAVESGLRAWEEDKWSFKLFCAGKWIEVVGTRLELDLCLKTCKGYLWWYNH